MGNPEISECGKAIKFLRDAHDVDHLVSAISASYLVQTYVDLPVEYGVFYVRHADTSRIVGINGKSRRSPVMVSARCKHSSKLMTDTLFTGTISYTVSTCNVC
jgi:hypothetical protein